MPPPIPSGSVYIYLTNPQCENRMLRHLPGGSVDLGPGGTTTEY